MRRSARPPSRPGSSRSDQLPIYLSMVSTKDNFLDTLLINRATGVPLYATITEVVTINWGPGGKSSRTTLTNRVNETVLLSEVSTTNQAPFGSNLEKKKANEINYSHGRFVSRWVQKHREYEPWFDVKYDDIVCHREQPLANSLPEASPSTSSLPPLGERPFATLTLCDIPGKPRVKISLHSRDSLQRITHEDGFTDIDHVVLGALLTCTHGGRKRGREPDGWLNEAQLQEHLRAQRQLYRARSTETLPLYQARPSAETLPPAYASRTSLQSRQSTR
ncbi:hypothetical protein FRC11_005581 [Ceratobasidium sp. 423]|nr:hypothetical protein FRC11_005581 [Ceratobasidium sp. 423]